MSRLDRKPLRYLYPGDIFWWNNGSNNAAVPNVSLLIAKSLSFDFSTSVDVVYMMINSKGAVRIYNKRLLSTHDVLVPVQTLIDVEYNKD